MWRRMSATSTGPSIRNARGNARLRSACPRQSRLGCTCAPRPGAEPDGSGTTRTVSASRTTTTRSSSDLDARTRQPTHIRIGCGRVFGSRPVRPTLGECTQRSQAAGFGRRRRPWPRSADIATARKIDVSTPYPVDEPAGVSGPASGADSMPGWPAAVSGRMSIRQPVSRAASRAFCPSRPIARDS